MSIGVIRLLLLIVMFFFLFFGNIQQINALSVLNQENRSLSQKKTTLESQKDAILLENSNRISQDIDKKLAEGKIFNIVLGDNVKLTELQEIVKEYQKKQEQPTNFTNTIVTR
jgi:hypothetical protein